MHRKRARARRAAGTISVHIAQSEADLFVTHPLRAEGYCTAESGARRSGRGWNLRWVWVAVPPLAGEQTLPRRVSPCRPTWTVKISTVVQHQCLNSTLVRFCQIPLQERDTSVRRLTGWSSFLLHLLSDWRRPKTHRNMRDVPDRVI